MLRRILKIVAVVLLLLLVTLGAAAWYANDWLEAHSDELADWASEKAGQRIRFEGVRISLRGGLGVVADGIEVGDESGADTQPEIKAERVEVYVSPFALLSGRVEIRSVVVRAPEVRWAKPLAFPIGVSSEGVLSETTSRLVLPVSVGQISVKDLTITGTIPGERPREFVVQVSDLEASDLLPGKRIQLDLLAKLPGGKEADLRASGTLGPVGAEGSLEGATLDMAIGLGPIDLGALGASPLVKNSIPDDVSMTGPIAAEMHLAGPLLRPSARVHIDATTSDLSFRKQVRKPAGLRAIADLEVAPTGRFEEILVALGSLEVKGTGQITKSKPPTLILDLHSNPWPLSELATLAPAAAPFALAGDAQVDLDMDATPGGERPLSARGTIALTNASATLPGPGLRMSGLNTRLELEDDSLRMPPSDMEIAGSPARVEATFDRLQPPRGSFSAEMARLDLGTLTAEKSASDLQATGVTLEGRIGEQESGRELNLDLKAKDGTLNKATFTDLSAKLRVTDPVTHIDSVDVAAFSGQISGKGSVERGDPERQAFRVEISARELDAAQIPWEDIAPSRKGGRVVAGRVTAQITLAGVRDPSGVDKESLKGSGQLEIRDGVLEGANPGERILRRLRDHPALSRLVTERLRNKKPELFDTQSKSFRKLSARFEIADLRIRIQNLSLDTDDYTIRASGAVGFDRQAELDGVLTASAARTAAMVQKHPAAGRLMNADGRIEIPFHATGKRPDVQVQIDRNALRKAIFEEGPQEGPQKRPVERLRQLREEGRRPLLDRLRRWREGAGQ